MTKNEGVTGETHESPGGCLLSGVGMLIGEILALPLLIGAIIGVAFIATIPCLGWVSLAVLAICLALVIAYVVRRIVRKRESAAAAEHDRSPAARG